MYYAKQNKSKKDKYHMISLMWNLINKRDEHGEKEKEGDSTIENKLWVDRGRWVGDMG